MKLLVTGVDGYIGAQLSAVLLGRGHDVLGVDTGFYREGWLYNHETNFPRTLNKDIREITEDDLRGMDAVVHLAELSNDPLGQNDPAITYQINHAGSVELAKKCIRVGVPRFVYASSCSVYGTGDGAGFKTETSQPNPQTAYAECKVWVERDLSAMASDNFSPTFLRNATAYGPSPRMRFDIVLNNLSGLAWTTKEIKMTSDGTPWRPLAHILDISHAVACALECRREIIHNQIFNVGSTEHNYQVRDIAEIVAGAFPGCKLSFGNSDGDNRSYRVSFDKIHSTLPGFVCRHDAETGARELATLFNDINMSSEIFQSRAYTRLSQLRHLISTGQVDSQLYWTTAKRLTASSPVTAAQAV
jgi:nucleoside-diphosphate-sugar epimerase